MFYLVPYCETVCRITKECVICLEAAMNGKMDHLVDDEKCWLSQTTAGNSIQVLYLSILVKHSESVSFMLKWQILHHLFQYIPFWFPFRDYLWTGTGYSWLMRCTRLSGNSLINSATTKVVPHYLMFVFTFIQLLHKSICIYLMQ